MGRFTKELQTLRNRIKKLKQKQGDNYVEAWFNYVITGKLPNNVKYRERIEHEGKNIQAMKATLPYSNKTECKTERTKVFGGGICNRCQWHNNCYNEDGYFKDDEIEDENFKEEYITAD